MGPPACRPSALSESRHGGWLREVTEWLGDGTCLADIAYGYVHERDSGPPERPSRAGWAMRGKDADRQQVAPPHSESGAPLPCWTSGISSRKWRLWGRLSAHWRR